MSFTPENFYWYLRATWEVKTIAPNQGESNIYPLGCTISTRTVKDHVSAFKQECRDYEKLAPLLAVSVGHWGGRGWFEYRRFTDKQGNYQSFIRESAKDTRLILLNTARPYSYVDPEVYEILGKPLKVEHNNGCHGGRQNTLYIVKDHDVDWKTVYEKLKDQLRCEKEDWPDFDMSQFQLEEFELEDE